MFSERKLLDESLVIVCINNQILIINYIVSPKLLNVIYLDKITQI